MKSTKDIPVPQKIVDQVVGQDEAVQIIKKAALQRRHVLLIGEPGTGKSMLGLALAELLPKSTLKDILALPNPNDENNPLIQTMQAGTGREEVKKYFLDGKQMFRNNNFLLFVVAIITLLAPWWIRNRYQSDIMFAAFFLGGILFLAVFSMMLSMGQRMFGMQKVIAPKVIVDNFGKKEAPFFDATGAHAGALLGDVLHDPFQSLGGSNNVKTMSDEKNLVEVTLGDFVDKKLEKNKINILKQEEKNYEAVFLQENKPKIFGETNGSISPVEVLSCNRYNYVGEMIKLTTSENKELIVTPEHKIAVWKNGKITYVEAKDIEECNEIVSQSDAIIDEQDIINSYDRKQQEQCKLYGEYLELKAQNPTWGYKRISKALGQSESKTRWWHAQKHIPQPIQTVQWLQKRKLLPLRIINSKLLLIAKVLGATFGDGGIFANLNAIFLSSSELEATKEFGNDLMRIFGYSIDNNMRTIRGGRNGTSFCYQNTNRNVIRFFMALGAPIGNKTKINLIVPTWIKTSEEAEQEFYASLFGSEIGISAHKSCGARIEFGITGDEHTELNRLQFLEEVKAFLNKRRVEIGKILSYKRKNKAGSKIFRIVCSQRFTSSENFSKNINLNYCKYKEDNLKRYLQNFVESTREKYQYYVNRGYGAQKVMERLELKPNELYSILNSKGTISA
ncbi:MAG: ATP-binding protein [Nanoarchaeota archaeon]|nr:ATP-binding protein [Nanoarchaeota archaeon]